MPRYRPASLVPPALALILLASPLSEALAQSRDVKVSGMGVRKCTEWRQWKESRNTESRAMALEWTQGFITGHNIYARGNSGPASSVVANVSVLIPLLDAYCQKNPEERIFAGVIEITKGLGGIGINVSPKAAPQNPQPEKKGQQES